MNQLIFIFLLLAAATTAAGEDLCEFFLYCHGSTGRTNKSLPSAIISGALNPGHLSKIKGTGIETLYQPQNPVGVSLVTGTGKVGAMVSSSTENSFFGNRTIEIDEVAHLRHLDSQRYRNKKIGMAIGQNVYDKKKLSLDIGLSLKRHSEIKRINPGIGVSGKLGELSFGYYLYKDDARILLNDYFHPSGVPYASIYNSNTYQETFNVSAMTVGARLRNLFLDYGLLKSRYAFYAEDTMIEIYSASYHWRKFLFNVALRKEASPNMKHIDGQMINQRKKQDLYLGMQYSMNRNMLFGVAYNNFLLGEISGTLTLSF